MWRFSEITATRRHRKGSFYERLAWNRMRMDPTDIADITGATYSYLINGKTAQENPFFTARPGQRVRLRFANASTMTFYDIRIPGLPMTVVQADGQNIQPVRTPPICILWPGFALRFDPVLAFLQICIVHLLISRPVDRFDK